MSRFVFVMQHQPTPEQLSSASEGDREVVQLANKTLLLVPDDPTLDRTWFFNRAGDVINEVGGIREDDTWHIMGQQQLAMAVSGLVRRRHGVTLMESVTPRVSTEVVQLDGSVKKENFFKFSGFRVVHKY